MFPAASITIPFEGQIASAVRVMPDTPPREALEALRLPPYAGMVVMHGGASKMTPEQIDTVRPLLTSVLAPLAEERRWLVVDGGTHAGAMAAMGEARRAIGGTFPLLGACPAGLIAYPGGPEPDDEHVPLDPWHSHFLFVDGDEFGIESDLLVGLLRAAEQPGVALIVNGGELVYHEALLHARLGNPLVIVAGTGRVADEIAAPNSERRKAMPPGAPLHIVSLEQMDEFAHLLDRLLAATGS